MRRSRKREEGERRRKKKEKREREKEQGKRGGRERGEEKRKRGGRAGREIVTVYSEVFHFSVFFYLGKVGFNGSHNLSDVLQEELSKSHFAA